MSENMNEVFEVQFADSEVITVPIDDTLSNSGEAADAAAVGAALALKADASSVVTIDVNGQEADNQGHIAIDGGDIQMSGTDTRTLTEAVAAAEGRTAADIPMSSAAGAQTIAEAVSAAGAANATTIPMAEDSTTTVAAKITAMDNTAAAQAAAITALQNKTAETILMQAGDDETVKEAVEDRLKSVNGIQGDANGNAEIMSVPLAENLASDQVQTNTDSFTMRTAGGGTSVNSGEAWLMNIRGASVHTGHVAETLNMTVTEAENPGHISATIDRDTFVDAVSGSGTTTMVYSNDDWSISGTVIDPADYGVTVTGTPASGDSIVIVYVEEVRGTITPTTPSMLTATGWNLYNHTDGCARVKKYSDWYGYGIYGAWTSLKYSATYTGTKSDITVVSGNFTVPDDGYVWVTGGDSTSTAIWATWGDWTDSYEGAFSAYTESSVDFSSVMQEIFPNGLLKAGQSVDEINFNIGQAISRVERMAYSPSNIAEAKASGREYEYDEDYIYLARAEAVVTSISGVDGGYTVNDHGLEWFAGTEIDTQATILYGNNLKNKLERDVLTISAQQLTAAQRRMVQANIGLASKVWTPATGETLISYIMGNVDKTGIPFSAIKVGAANISDSPVGTNEFTILVTGAYDRMTVELREYGTNADVGKAWIRSIWQNAWMTGSSWVCPLNDMLIAQQYTFDYTSVAANTRRAITASEFGITAKTGYTPIGIIAFETGNSILTVARMNATTSGEVLALRNSTGSAASAATPAMVVMLWAKTTVL